MGNILYAPDRGSISATPSCFGQPEPLRCLRVLPSVQLKHCQPRPPALYPCPAPSFNPSLAQAPDLGPHGNCSHLCTDAPTSPHIFHSLLHPQRCAPPRGSPPPTAPQEHRASSVMDPRQCSCSDRSTSSDTWATPGRGEGVGSPAPEVVMRPS